MRGSLHCATDDETVRCFGRDDGDFGSDEVAQVQDETEAMAATARTVASGNICWRDGFVEDHGVEAVAGEEAEFFVELDGGGVGFGDG